MECRDYLYDPSKVTPELRPLFAYLQAELGTDYEIWVRVEDFERRISAGVVNHHGSSRLAYPCNKDSSPSARRSLLRALPPFANI
jgi:hypothetical protein